MSKVTIGTTFPFNGETYRVSKIENGFVYAGKKGKRGRPSKFRMQAIQDLSGVQAPKVPVSETSVVDETPQPQEKPEPFQGTNTLEIPF